MRYKGNAASEGIAIGRVLQYRAYTAKVEKKEIDPGEIEQEKVRWRTACERAKEELRALCKTLEQTDPDKAAIFEAHQDIVQDVALEEDIVGEIEDGGCNAEWATAKIYDRYARRLEKAADERMRARAADLYDVKNRILRCCEGKAEKNLSALEQPVVVMAHDLFPSDTATLDRKNVLGIVTEVGGQTSHSAIIARSYGIPALLGVTGCMEQVQEGTQVCVDAVDGELITEPDAAYLAALQEKKTVFEQVREDTERYRREEGRTADGTRIEVELNVGDPNEKELSASAYTDGVGLFRTEFLYMGRRDLPDEDEQAEGKHILVVAGDIACGEGFGEAENQSAEHGAGNGADAAEHRRDEGLEAGEDAHVGVDLRVAQGPHDARGRRQRGAEPEGQRDDAVDPHPEQARGLDVLGDGPHGQPRFGAVDDPQEPEHEHEADHGHDQRDRQQLQLPEIDGRHEPFRLVHGARKTGKHHHGEAFDEEGHGDGTDERRNARGVAQRPVGDAVHQNADGAGREDGHHHGHPPGQEECRGAVKDEIGPQHENVAVGEVDQPQYPVHHRVPDGDEAIQGTQCQGIEEVLEEHVQTHSACLIR